MEMKDVVAKRSSVRHFVQEPVPADDLREMVRLAGLSPSVNNAQPWRFIAITNKPLLHSMAQAVHSKISLVLPDSDDQEEKKAKSQVDWFSTFFADAPAVIAVARCPYEAVVDCALHGSDLTHEQVNAARGYPDIQSIGAAVQTLILAATDLGYGSCWLSGPLIAREELEQTLGIEAPWHLAAMVAIGKPSTDTPQRAKKPFEEIFELRS